MSKKITLLTFKGICMNFLLELNFFVLSHPVTSKQPHKIVQIHMGHPVDTNLQECLKDIKSKSYPKIQASFHLAFRCTMQLAKLSEHIPKLFHHFQ